MYCNMATLRGAIQGSSAVYSEYSTVHQFGALHRKVHQFDALTSTPDVSRYQLERFRGAIAAADSVAVLSSVAVSASWIEVHLLTPLSLSALEGRCEDLVMPYKRKTHSLLQPGSHEKIVQPARGLEPCITESGRSVDTLIHSVTRKPPQDEAHLEVIKEVVYVRALEAADGGVWPLPAQPPPRLRVTDVQRGTWRDVVHTVQAYAPHGNRSVCCHTTRIE
ncbi:hypothetical protein FHG87_024650 [Trinorchestia longiramus]|nr:hypothetical protein FHG87_024650 [Trinorchestia longiramus]